MIRLTQYSHGGGCGCKIAPDVLEKILHSAVTFAPDPKLLVGNASKDDAAAYDLGDGRAVLSTTDFFMPIVDNPFDFGRIAATNAISDIYAMGGTPLLAIAILGWPIQRLPPEVAREVVDGGRSVCAALGIPLAGGHSIDSPEPIFGLAVTGLVAQKHLMRNDRAPAGARLYLTKPLGVGILTTAEKRGLLRPEHATLALETMTTANAIGAVVAAMPAVRAMTDVTGFGLMGHLLELCEGSGVNAILFAEHIPALPAVSEYIAQDCLPGGTARNFKAYGARLGALSAHQRALYCDPQTSGGLLIAVQPEGAAALEATLAAAGLYSHCIGELLPADGSPTRIQLQ